MDTTSQPPRDSTAALMSSIARRRKKTKRAKAEMPGRAEYVEAILAGRRDGMSLDAIGDAIDMHRVQMDRDYDWVWKDKLYVAGRPADPRPSDHPDPDKRGLTKAEIDEIWDRVHRETDA